MAQLLASYHFPGNVRELRGMVFDAVSLHQSRKLSMEAFKRAMGLSDLPAAPAVVGEEPLLGFGERLPTMDQALELLIEEAMRRAAGNQTLASSFLGISRPALSKRLRKSGVQRV